MKITGSIFAAMLTPLDNREQINLDAIAPLINYILSKGVDGLYVGGSSGEGMLQSLQERSSVLQAVASHGVEQCTLIAHVGATSTADAVALAEVASANNYSAISAVPPFYYKHSFDAISAYYQAIAEVSDLPLIIYNIPALSGNDMSTQNLLQLMQNSRIAGVKYTATDLFQFQQLRQQAPDKSFYFGTDEMFLSAAAIGTDGGIGSTYNLIGDVYVNIQKALALGNIEEAKKLQCSANNLVQILLETGVLPGLKHALNFIGINVGPCRKPFNRPSAESIAKLESWIEQNLLIE